MRWLVTNKRPSISTMGKIRFTTNEEPNKDFSPLDLILLVSNMTPSLLSESDLFRTWMKLLNMSSISTS